MPELSSSLRSVVYTLVTRPDGRRLILAGLMLALLPGLLGGCSPRFNWREVRSDESGYRVMFPDRPDSLTRSIHLESLAVDMTMQGARAEGMTFAVGTIRLPEATPATAETDAQAVPEAGAAAVGSPAPGSAAPPGSGSSSGASAPAGAGASMEGRRARALEAMRAQLVRNIHGHELKTEGVSVPLIDAAGQKVGATEEAMSVEIVGERPPSGNSASAAGALQMRGLFAGRGDHVYQVVVLGPRIDAEQAATFFESFKLLR